MGTRREQLGAPGPPWSEIVVVPENRQPIPKDQRWSRERIRPKYKIMLEELDKGLGQIFAKGLNVGMALQRAKSPAGHVATEAQFFTVVVEPAKTRVASPKFAAIGG